MPKPGVDPTSGISSGDVMVPPERHPACRRREAQLGSCTEREKACSPISLDHEIARVVVGIRRSRTRVTACVMRRCILALAAIRPRKTRIAVRWCRSFQTSAHGKG